MTERTQEKGCCQEELNAVFSAFGGEKSELIPILQAVQDKFGYITEGVLPAVAGFLNVSESYVYGVVTFYTQFTFKPQGKYRIKVCEGTACHVRGSDEIIDTVQNCLGIKAGETTPDGNFSISTVACVGACALAPVVVIGDKINGAMTSAKSEKLLSPLIKETTSEEKFVASD